MTKIKMDPDLSNMIRGVLAQDRRALARAITLVESTNKGHQEQAYQLIDALLSHTGKAIRVGVSGPPGVGKSTLIETLGLWLIDHGLSVAVLAVDPTSPITKGSLLGDKTRMQKLSVDAKAYIRPSPSQGALGGVATQTREAMLICEAAGFDVILVETVGVGQSEFAVASMVDTFVLLLQPGGGDELQGVKKGILELADILVINKADGDLKKLADEAKREYARAMALLRRSRHDGFKTPVIKMSALKNEGIEELWKCLLAHRAFLEAGAELAKKRGEQAEHWFWDIIQVQLLETFKNNEAIKRLLPTWLEQIENNNISPVRAANDSLNAFWNDRST